MIFSVKVFNFDCSVLNQERGVNENWEGVRIGFRQEEP